MAYGYKTGGRQKGTPNKDKALKLSLRAHSDNYFTPDPDDPDGRSPFDKDLEKLKPAERVEAEIKILSFHTPKQQSTSVDISIDTETSPLLSKLATLALDNDKQ